MIAMILAAGRGERMLPLTRLLPKAALPVLGRPLAEQILRRLVRHGIRTAVLNLHHLGDQLVNLLGDGTEFGLEQIHYSPEETILGTAGGIRNAAEYLRGGGTILVQNSDFLCDVDLGAATAAHLASGAPATLVLAPVRPGYSAIEVDAAGRVLSLAGRPKADRSAVAGRYLFTGLYLIEESVIDRIPSVGASDVVGDVFVPLVAEKGLASFVHDGFWWEFGSPREYLEGCLRLFDLPLKTRSNIAETDSMRVIGNATVAMGCGAELHPGSVELAGRVAIGFASLVAEGASLEDTIVMNEAWIGPGCRLRRVVVAPGAEIPAGFQLDDAVICPDPDPNEALPTAMERHNGLRIRRFEPSKR